MKLSKRSVAVLGAGLMTLGGLAAAPAASALDCADPLGAPTATTCTTEYTTVVGGTGLTGVRYISTAAVTPGAASNSTGTVPGVLSVSVTEVTKPGANWSVSAVTSELTGLAEDGTTPVTAIPASSVSLAAGAVPPLSVGCLDAALLDALECTPVGVTPGELDVPQTVFGVTDASTSSVYSGVYTGTGNISVAVPNGASLGTYTGTMTVTLVNG